MQLRKAVRSAAKLRIGLSATSGSGKSYGALLIAKGLCGDLSKVAIIDTENGSADLYAHLGNYNVLTLNVFSPEKYIEAIDTCEKAGMEVIIIDSITHEWNFLLEIHGAMSGNSFTNWAYITPRHEKFKNKILQSSCHIITTVRRKTEYAIDQSSGKTKIEKVGTKEQSREGWEYELTVNLEIDENHKAKASKDRTGIFVDRDLFIITEEDGKTLREWSLGDSSETEASLQIALVEINNSSSKEELTIVYTKFKALQENPAFIDAVKNKNATFVA